MVTFTLGVRVHEQRTEDALCHRFKAVIDEGSFTDANLADCDFCLYEDAALVSFLVPWGVQFWCSTPRPITHVLWQVGLLGIRVGEARHPGPGGARATRRKRKLSTTASPSTTPQAALVNIDANQLQQILIAMIPMLLPVIQQQLAQTNPTGSPSPTLLGTPPAPLNHQRSPARAPLANLHLRRLPLPPSRNRKRNPHRSPTRRSRLRSLLGATGTPPNPQVLGPLWLAASP